MDGYVPFCFSTFLFTFLHIQTVVVLVRTPKRFLLSFGPRGEGEMAAYSCE